MPAHFKPYNERAPEDRDGGIAADEGLSQPLPAAPEAGAPMRTEPIAD